MEYRVSRLSKLFNFVCVAILLVVIVAPGMLVTRAGSSPKVAAAPLADDPQPTQETPPDVEPERPAGVQPAAPGAKVLGVDAPQATYKWFGNAGAGFIPSSNSMTWLYAGSGCVHPTTAGAWRSNVNLPDNSSLKSLWIGYWNYTGSTSTTGQLYKYSASNGAATAIGTVNTLAAASGGTGFKYSSVTITDTVDNAWYTYMFMWGGATPASVQELCYMQVGYIPPSIFGYALPLVTK